MWSVLLNKFGVLQITVSWNREECFSPATLYAVRIHTRRSLDRHDYTHFVELTSSTHPSQMYIVLLCLFTRFQPKILTVIMVFLSTQNAVVRISTDVKQGSKEDQMHESCSGGAGVRSACCYED